MNDLNVLLTILRDQDFAARVADDCHDQYHDDRYCPTCSARMDGIDAYQMAVLERFKRDVAQGANDGQHEH